MNKRVASPPARLWLPVLALFSLHNIEEIGLDLPAWGRAHGFVLPTTALDRTGFALLIAGLTLAVIALAYALRASARFTRLALLGFLGAMALNFVQHIALSLVTTSVQPGVISAVLLMPVFGWLFLRAWRLRG